MSLSEAAEAGARMMVALKNSGVIDDPDAIDVLHHWLDSIPLRYRQRVKDLMLATTVLSEKDRRFFFNAVNYTATCSSSRVRSRKAAE